jgi:replicative DNA helicase
MVNISEKLENDFLGSILIDSSKILDADLVKPEMLSERNNQIIYEAILDLYSKGEHIDTVSVYSKLNKKIDAAYISKLSEDINFVTSSQIKKYSCLIFENNAKRRLDELADQIKESGDSDVFELMEKIETDIFTISQNAYQKKYRSIQEITGETVDLIVNAKTHGITDQRIMTDFYDLDKIIGGLAKTDLIILAARPSMGKTSLALNIAENIASKKAVGFFSLEMSETQLCGRLISSNSGITSTALFTGSFRNEESYKISNAAKHINELKLYIDDTPGITPIELRSKARKLKLEKDIQLVIVDYLQLMHCKSESREREISTISKSLKNLAKELDIPVLALSQLNRGVESRNDKRPLLSDLRESGSIEQDADIVVFIYRPEIYGQVINEKGENVEGTAEVIVRKNRSGALGTANLIFEKEKTKFLNSTNAQNDYEGW